MPVTAPTAKVTAMTFDHRRASRIASASSRRTPIQFATRTIIGNATPMQAKGMWKASVKAICSRAARRFEDEAAITGAFLPLGRRLG